MGLVYLYLRAIWLDVVCLGMQGKPWRAQKQEEKTRETGSTIVTK